MLKSQVLLYAGTAWPTAEVVDRRTIVTKSAAQPRRQEGVELVLGATGIGKPWTARRPMAFWRDFTPPDGARMTPQPAWIAELDLGLTPDRAVVRHVDEVEAPVLAFVRRWGDPGGKIDGKAGVAESFDWVTLSASLLHISRAWDEPGADGVSRYSGDYVRVREAIAHWRNFLFPNIAADIELQIDPVGGIGLVPRANTLAAFMGLSAASAMARAVPMRRCQHCDGWFELARRDARYCSAACRAREHLAQTTD